MACPENQCAHLSPPLIRLCDTMQDVIAATLGALVLAAYDFRSDLTQKTGMYLRVTIDIVKSWMWMW